MNLDPVPRQKTRKPKSVAPALMRYDHPRNRPAGARGTRLQPFDQLRQRRTIPFDHTPRMLFHARKLNGEPPFFRTQLQSADQSAIVIESRGRRRRISSQLHVGDLSVRATNLKDTQILGRCSSPYGLPMPGTTIIACNALTRFSRVWAFCL